MPARDRHRKWQASAKLSAVSFCWTGSSIVASMCIWQRCRREVPPGEWATADLSFVKCIINCHLNSLVLMKQILCQMMTLPRFRSFCRYVADVRYIKRYSDRVVLIIIILFYMFNMPIALVVRVYRFMLGKFFILKF